MASKTQKTAQKPGVAPKKVLEMMKEATGASDEDICVMLQLCGGDANEATEKLLESEPLLGPSHVAASGDTQAGGSPCWSLAERAACSSYALVASMALSSSPRSFNQAHPPTHPPPFAADPFEKVKTKQEKRREVSIVIYCAIRLQARTRHDERFLPSQAEEARRREVEAARRAEPRRFAPASGVSGGRGRGRDSRDAGGRGEVHAARGFAVVADGLAAVFS